MVCIWFTLSMGYRSRVRDGGNELGRFYVSKISQAGIRIGMKEWHIFRWWHEKKFITHRHERITHLSFVAWKDIRYALAWKNDASFVCAMKRNSLRIGMKEWRIFHFWHEKTFVTHWHERITHLWFLAGRGHFGVLWFGEVIWFAPDGQTNKQTDRRKKGLQLI